MIENKNFLLAPVLRNTAKGGKIRQIIANARRSLRTLLTCTGTYGVKALSVEFIGRKEGFKGPFLL